jgi:tRNA 2-thiouridine synthesizing protein B
MSTLHTVNKSPFATQTLQSCLNHAKDGDAVLMIEDGVYGAATGTAMADAIAARAGSVSVYALAPDMAARGIGAGRLIDGVKTVDYAGFVELAAQHDRAQNWL